MMLPILISLAATAQEPASTPPAPALPPAGVSPAESSPTSAQTPSAPASAPAKAAAAPDAPAPPKPAPDPNASTQPAPPAPPALTAEEFLRLWEASDLEDRVLRQRPPVEGVIRSASYTATVLGQPNAPTGLGIEAVLEVQSFQKGWSVVPISSLPLPVINSETKNAFLTLRDEGYVVLLPEEGIYPVKLSLAFPVASLEGTPTADIKLPQSPVSSFTGSLPGTGWSVKTVRHLFPVRISPEGNNTTFSFSPGSLTSFQLQWEKAEEDKARETVIFAETEVLTQLRPDAVRSEAKLTFELQRAPVSSFRVSLSPDHELLSVSGEAIKSWKLQKEEKSQWLELWLSAPQRDRYELHLVLEQNVPQLPFPASLPVIRVEGALRQAGNFELVEEQDVTTTLNSLQNLTRQASTFHPAGHQRHLGRYRFLRGDYGASLKIAETTPQIGASAETLLHIGEVFSSFHTTIRLDIQDRAILQSIIVLPAGFELQKVDGDAVREYEMKGSRLSVSYRSPQLGAVQFELTGRKPRREGGAEEMELPHFTVENAIEYRGTVRLEVPPSIQVEVRNDASPMALRPAPASFEYLNTPSPSSLVVTRKAPQVEVVLATDIHFKHHETTILCSLDYQIRNRFPERLLLRVPANLSELVEFKSSTLAVVNRKASPTPSPATRAEDESLFSYWELHDPNQTLGAHHVELSLTDKLPDPLYNQPLITPSLLIVPLQADRLDGKIRISLDENVALKPVTETSLRMVTGEPAGPERGPSFEFSSSDADLTVAVTRLRYVELPALAVDLADVTHVVSGDGSISSEVAYRVIIDQPSDLEIQLPAGAQMSSQVFCNEAPIAPRQTTEENLVAVTIRPEKQGGDTGETIVRFTYDVPTPKVSKSLESRGDLPIPVASLRNARTLDSRTTLFLPPAYRYFDFATPMTLESNVPGWTRAKQYLSRLLPSLEAWTGQVHVAPEGTAAVPPIPPFDYRIPLRKEGQKFTFAHSAAPDVISVSYLSQRYATLLEAGAFFLALFLGILISRQSLEAKLVFLVFAGALALVAASFSAPHMAAIYYAVCLGAVSSVAFWLFAGVVSLFQGIRLRSPASPAPGSFPVFPQPGEIEPENRSAPEEDREPEPEPARPETSSSAKDEKMEPPGQTLASRDGNGDEAAPSKPAERSPVQPGLDPNP